MTRANWLTITGVLVVPVLISCNNHDSLAKPLKQDTTATVSTSNPKEPLAGIWIQHDSTGFRMIEIIDSTQVLFFGFADKKNDRGSDADDRYWYYKSKAVMGHWNPHSIWIGTDKFRFDYNISGDTLIEFDKMGEQGKFIRVHSDNEN